MQTAVKIIADRLAVRVAATAASRSLSRASVAAPKDRNRLVRRLAVIIALNRVADIARRRAKDRLALYRLRLSKKRLARSIAACKRCAVLRRLT